MPHTLVMFSAVKQCATLLFIPMASDQSQTPAGNGLSVPAGWNHVLGTYVLAPHAHDARLVSPSLRKWCNHYLIPVEAAANPPANPCFQYYDYDSSIPLTVGDELDAEVENTNTSERTDVLLWLGTKPIQPVQGTMVTAKFTSNATLVANAWTLGALTPVTSLEAGLWQIVGMYTHFAGAVAARIVFPGALNAIRPGCIGATTPNLQMPPTFRYGELGVWGVFQGAVLPQVEFWSTLTPTTEYVWFDLVKGPTGLESAGIAQPAFGSLFMQHAMTG